jgi:hypothetical protein
MVRRSTISGNHTVDPGTPGGGISAPGAFTLESSTVSGNWVAGSTSSGGGLRVTNATIRNSTISGNRVEGGSSPGGGIFAGGGDPTIVNTIVANNTVVGGGPHSDLGSGTASDEHQLAYSLIETTPDAGNYVETTPGSNLLGIDPMLGGLASDGGPTQTHSPQPSSPVLDQGNSDETTDQRGFARPADFRTATDAAGGDASDIGGVEIQIAPPTFTGTTPASPSSDDAPEVRGNIPTGPDIDDEDPLVVLFAVAGCPLPSTLVASSQDPTVFSGPGITVGPLAHNATTTIYGTTLSDYGSSVCSSGAFPNTISYTHADPPPGAGTPGFTAPAATGLRAAALKKCKKKKTKAKRRKCRKKARLLPL